MGSVPRRSEPCRRGAGVVVVARVVFVGILWTGCRSMPTGAPDAGIGREREGGLCALFGCWKMAGRKYTISGKIVGKWVPMSHGWYVSCELEVPDEPPLAITHLVSVGWDGVFEVPCLTAGTYRLRVMREGPPEGPNELRCLADVRGVRAGTQGLVFSSDNW